MNRPFPNRSPRPNRSRRGAMIVLIAALIAILLTMTVFSVDVAYMQLVRTELRVATDAAAKAGAEALVRMQDDDEAVAAAIAAAARNDVAGRPLTIAASDVVLGRSELDANGDYTFEPWKKPYTAVQVNAAMNDGTAAGSVDLMFASAIGSGKYTPAQTATASQLDHDIILCVDRSHSMAFDLTGTPWSYPPGHGTIPHTVAYPPDPELSRWASLVSACQLLVDTLDTRQIRPHTALVTWGSEIDRDTAEYLYTGQTEVAVRVDMPLMAGYPGLVQHLHNRTGNVMLGGTNMSAGIDASVALLTAPSARRFSNKSILLMTDGQWNRGRDPIEAARDARDAGITIYTVTFLGESDVTTMQQVANITGGRHYHANDREELERAFVSFANSLPILLTE